MSLAFALFEENVWELVAAPSESSPNGVEKPFWQEDRTTRLYVNYVW